MSRTKLNSAIALSILLAQAGVARGQSTAIAPATSTQSGVYTAEQARRGKDVYFGKCRSCHEPSTGDAFARLWADKTVLDLFGYILKTMPSNDPGTLDPYDDADVVAYILQVTGMPTGGRELPADADSLKAIRIDVKGAKKDPPPLGAATHRAALDFRERRQAVVANTDTRRRTSSATSKALDPLNES